MFFFFNDTATTEIYTLSLHDALPISTRQNTRRPILSTARRTWSKVSRSEEHTSELQSHDNLVCRLLLEKKNTRHLFPSFHAAWRRVCDKAAPRARGATSSTRRGSRKPGRGSTILRCPSRVFFLMTRHPPKTPPPPSPPRSP